MLIHYYSPDVNAGSPGMILNRFSMAQAIFFPGNHQEGQPLPERDPEKIALGIFELANTSKQPGLLGRIGGVLTLERPLNADSIFDHRDFSIPRFDVAADYDAYADAGNPLQIPIAMQLAMELARSQRDKLLDEAAMADNTAGQIELYLNREDAADGQAGQRLEILDIEDPLKEKTLFNRLIPISGNEGISLPEGFDRENILGVLIRSASKKLQNGDPKGLQTTNVHALVSPQGITALHVSTKYRAITAKSFAFN